MTNLGLQASLEPADIEGLIEAFIFLCGQHGAEAAFVTKNAFVRSFLNSTFVAFRSCFSKLRALFPFFPARRLDDSARIWLAQRFRTTHHDNATSFCGCNGRDHAFSRLLKFTRRMGACVAPTMTGTDCRCA